MYFFALSQAAPPLVIDKATKIPVTVKTRLGWDDKTQYIEEVAEKLQDVGIKAISIHGRTRKQMYKGVANWELIKRVKKNPRIQIPVFGNGDVTDAKSALKNNTTLKHETLKTGLIKEKNYDKI